MSLDFTYEYDADDGVEEDTDARNYHEEHEDEDDADADDEDGGDDDLGKGKKRKGREARKLFVTVRGGRIVGNDRQDADRKAEVSIVHFLRYCFLIFAASQAKLKEIATTEGSPGYTKR